MTPAPLTVLVVEDSETIAALLDTLLEAEGHAVRVVDRGFHALLDPAHPLWTGVDVLLSDLMLEDAGPPVTGLDILTVCRDHHPTVRRIALTAAGSPLYEQARALADVTLPKPSEVDAIVRAVAAT